MVDKLYSSAALGKEHPDFAISWTQKVLNGPELEIIPELPPGWQEGLVTNAMFDETLSHERGLRARVMFRRPCSESDSVSKWEHCYLLSVGHGIDGRTGRGHGGFSSLVLDHLTGTAAHRENQRAEPPATATMTVDYKAPVSTPCVILARSWPIEISGRKIWLKGVLEDMNGRPYATAKALFVNPREAPNL
ncbi:Putative Thioesterase domain, HotDog domain superfamily [Septoria linicola]|uniref:Thioesterase domain, HotDog domain superfamily n=1 Tax=Septoria linicola TaxID=215465 RepID=A0A9Q9AJP0_9PEZI|nr:putative Thioesterase domain, HotDog domain superfamily [Septoria linicola]USW50602.1 Putative Thioesterase domain, HotDog domain superfamily [Septoria linicola]